MLYVLNREQKVIERKQKEKEEGIEIANSHDKRED